MTEEEEKFLLGLMMTGKNLEEIKEALEEKEGWTYLGTDNSIYQIEGPVENYTLLVDLENEEYQLTA